MATKVMVLSNNQRVLTPMERANAYKMYLEACVHESQRGRRTDLGKTGEIGKEEALKMLGDKYKTTRSQILRYLSLSDLIPEFQKMIQNNSLSLTPGAELGKLSPKDQKNAYNYLTYLDKSPTLSEVQEMRRVAKEGPLTDTKLKFILDDSYKGLIPEWIQAYEDKKIGDMALMILADFTEPHQKVIFQASNELGKTPTVPLLRTIEEKTKNCAFVVETVKGILDPSYHPASQEKQEVPPEKPEAPAYSVKTNLSEPSGSTAAPSTNTGAANPPVPVNFHSPEPANHAPLPPSQTAASSNGPAPAPVPPASPEPPKPKEDGIFIPLEKVKAYFPKTYTLEKMEESIYKVLEGWHKKQEQKKSMSR